MTDDGYSVYSNNGYNMHCQGYGYYQPRYGHSSVYQNGHQYLQANNSSVSQQPNYQEDSYVHPLVYQNAHQGQQQYNYQLRYDHSSVYHNEQQYLQANNSSVSQQWDHQMNSYCQQTWNQSQQRDYYSARYDHSSVYQNEQQYLQVNNLSGSHQVDYQEDSYVHPLVYQNAHQGQQQYNYQLRYDHSSVYHNGQQYLQANNSSVSQQQDCHANWCDQPSVNHNGHQYLQTNNSPMSAGEIDVTTTGDPVDDLDLNVTSAERVDDRIVNGISNQVSELERDNQQIFDGSVTMKPKHSRGCDKTDMFVQCSGQFPKKLCCPFCDKLYTKLAKHMETKHKEEEDVKRFLNLPKGSKERRAIQDSLRKIGSLNWNKNPSKNKKRELIVSRRPNKKLNKSEKHFTTCSYCFGQYVKSALRLHVKYKCPNKPKVKDEITKGERKLTSLATFVEARHHENVSEALENVMKHLRDSEAVRCIKFDWLIVVYGNKLCKKYTRAKRMDMIQNQLRLVGRILHELKKIQPEIADFATLYRPKYYDSVLEAIQKVARYDTTRNEYGAPATASSSVTAIKKIGTLLRAEYIRKEDQENQRITENFLTLMDSDIHDSINRAVHETQNKRKRQKGGVILPSMDDLKVLAQHIEVESDNCMKKLSKSFDYKVWLSLSQLTLASIIAFNRKRVGDAEDITIEEFNNREVVNESTNELLFGSLSAESKETAKQYSRLIVRGKRDHDVAVLMKKNTEKQIDFLLSHREDAGILPKNEFVFALPSSLGEIKVINGCNVMNKLARACGAKNPSSLTGTNMRKQLATFCVSLELNDTEVADVADFMGHAEKVHRQYYRQNTIDRHLVKISKVLEAAQGNRPPVAADQLSKNGNGESSTVHVLENVQGDFSINNCSTTVGKRVFKAAQVNVVKVAANQGSTDKRVRSVRKRRTPSSSLQTLETVKVNLAISNRSANVRKRKTPQFRK